MKSNTSICISLASLGVAVTTEFHRRQYLHLLSKLQIGVCRNIMMGSLLCSTFFLGSSYGSVFGK